MTPIIAIFMAATALLFAIVLVAPGAVAWLAFIVWFILGVYAAGTDGE